MLSLFTTCKPHKGLNAIHQDNAILSWLLLNPTPRIVVCGDDEGVADLCKKYQLLHIKSAKLTEFGRPDVSWVFDVGWMQCPDGYIPAYINADILLYQDFVTAAQRLFWQHPRFMMCGQRLNLDVTERIEDFEAVRQAAVANGDYLKPTGTDYFAFVRGMLEGLAEGLGIGDLAWDNYLPWYAVTHDGAVFVDATACVTAVHQNHPERDRSTDLAALRNHAIVRAQDPEHPGVYCGLQLPDADYKLQPVQRVHFDAPSSFPIVEGQPAQSVQWDVKSGSITPQTVSIVIPSMNRAERLERCVRRILEVTRYRPLEVIVVIDVDLDSRARVEALQSDVVQVLFNPERKGAITCWNQGLAAATGNILVFFNDDCYPEPGWLEAALKTHRDQLGGYGVCGFNDGYQDGNVLAVQFLYDRAFCIDHLGGVMAFPIFKFAFNDTAVNDIAKREGRFYWCREAVVQHEHWSRDGGQMDDLNRENMRLQGEDGYVYDRWKAADFPMDFDPVIRR